MKLAGPSTLTRGQHLLSHPEPSQKPATELRRPLHPNFPHVPLHGITQEKFCPPIPSETN